MASRKFTLRRNGMKMTTFRVRIDLSQAQIDDLVARNEIQGGVRELIEQVLGNCLTGGVERFCLDSSLDPDRQEA